MLIAGGATIIISFIMATLYVAPQITADKNGQEYRIAPGEKLEVKRRITTGQALYTVLFSQLEDNATDVSSGSSRLPTITIVGPANETMAQVQADSALKGGVIEAPAVGNYTLSITNPAQEGELGALVYFNEQQPTDIAASFILYGGIIVLVAGVAVAIVDRVRSKKMKQYGDLSDLR